MTEVWTHLMMPGLPVWEKILRAIFVYAFLVVGLRLSGKRELAQLNPFDLVVLLTLSNTVQNSIIGEDNSLLGGQKRATSCPWDFRARQRSHNWTVPPLQLRLSVT